MGTTQHNPKAVMQLSNYSFSDDTLLEVGTGKAKLYVPNVGNLRPEVLNHFHGQGHLGSTKVYNEWVQYAYWPKMYDDVINLVNQCRVC